MAGADIDYVPNGELLPPGQVLQPELGRSLAQRAKGAEYSDRVR